MAEHDAGPIPFTPAAMGLLAGQLAEVIDVLRDKGVRVINAGRLQDATRVLRQVAQADAFPREVSQLKQIAAAARDAQEFVEISSVLPHPQLGVLAADVQNAVGGSYAARKAAGSKRAGQYQTQLWVMGMIGHGGVRPQIPPAGPARRPDAEVQDGTLRYGFEVKRPEATLKANKVVSEAARQLHSGRYHGGHIVVDLTDCLPDDVAIRIGTEPIDKDERQRIIIGLAAELHYQVFDDDIERMRTGREHILGVTAMGRFAYWNPEDLRELHLSRYVATVVYRRGCEGTLLHHRANWLGRRIHDGIEQAGHVAVVSSAIIIPPPREPRQ